jgi:Zn-dependent protease
MRYQKGAMGVLRFGLFGFQVHIQPGFWLLALLTFGLWRRGFTESFVFLAIVFVSILTHELGHAFAARRAGLAPVIMIHAFGGITRWLSNGPMSSGRTVAIAMAGPAAGMLLAALSTLAVMSLHYLAAAKHVPHLRTILVTLGQVNAFWSLLNLLPIMPFDGGQILAQLLGPKHRAMTAGVSLAVGCITSVLLYRLGLPTAAFVFGLAAIVQFVAVMRTVSRIAAVDEARLELLLRQARRALEQEDTEAAEKTAEAIIGLSGVAERRREAAEIFAWAVLGQGQYKKARRVFEILTAAPLDPLLQAAILEADGDEERAITCLRQARVAGDERPQVAASLVRLLLSADRYAEAALTTIQILNHVAAEEARQVMFACRDGGRPVPAAELGMALFSQTGSVDDLAWALVSYSACGNRDAVAQSLAAAAEQQITPSQLLDSAAFATVSENGELRQLVGSMSGAVQPAQV